MIWFSIIAKAKSRRCPFVFLMVMKQRDPAALKEGLGWELKGWMAKLTYHVLKEGVPLQAIANDIGKLKNDRSPTEQPRRRLTKDTFMKFQLRPRKQSCPT